MSTTTRRIGEFLKRYDDTVERGVYPYLRRIDRAEGAKVWVQGREMLMFASYCYLGLLRHPRIDDAAARAVQEFGTGTHGVRILAGTTALHDELEETIARFKGREAAIAFSSGYVTNLATISTLVGRRDLVLCDKLDHASIVDGCRLSGAKFDRWEHNNVQSLEDRLRAESNAHGTTLVIVDAVFSMDGDITPLPDILELAKRYGAVTMVDEAHSLGVLGETGHGIEEHFGVRGQTDILMGTLSKTIPSVGGYIAGRSDLVNFLKHTARAFVFSAALPPPSAAAATEAFAVIEDEPWRREKLWANREHFVSGLHELGFDTLWSETPVIPIVFGAEEPTLLATKMLDDRGIFMCPILPPAVPPHTCRLRATVTAAHEPDQIDRALEALAEVGKELGLIN
jgi:8-amino-7-oxononanoate synthase